MQRGLVYLILCLGVVASACDRGDTTRAKTGQIAADDARPRDRIEVTGCVTANAETNQFVLTASSTALTSLTNRSAGTGEAETFHYQLVGGNNLPEYIGKEVVVTGVIAVDGKDVDIKATDKTPDVPEKRGDDVTPAIESSHEIEMQVERLNVASIAATGAPCQIGQRR